MRSRYSAFVLGLERYLLDTWHPSRRPQSIELDRNQKWLGLMIVDTATIDAATIGAPTIDKQWAEVEFIARYRIGGASAARLHERSRFVREGGSWFYVDGDIRTR
jgi:SEC-C motif-containing protein